MGASESYTFPPVDRRLHDPLRLELHTGEHNFGRPYNIMADVWGSALNSKQVAEQFGTGIQFCEHRDGIPEEERVKEVVRLVLTEDEGE
jgi:hypothetical protein